MPLSNAASRILLAGFCVSSHVFVLLLLSTRQGQQSQYPRSSPHPIFASTIRWVGLLSTVLTFALPYLLFPNRALLQSGLRCVCFFYGCKLLHLSLAKADSPPIRRVHNHMHSENDAHAHAPMDAFCDHCKYVYLLLTEMRYASFDIAIKQNGRLAADADKLEKKWAWIPPFAIVGLVTLIPIPETKSLLLLLLIELGLEMLHTTFHFSRESCRQPLFYKPFAAASFTSFWTTHWHAAAAPFLHSLVYQPGKQYVGRWFGVLATFNLTGIWHAWAFMPLLEPAYATFGGFQVWSMFMIMGLGVLVESFLPPRKQGNFVHMAVVWTVALLSAGWCFRTLECHSRLDCLRTERCELSESLKQRTCGF